MRNVEALQSGELSARQVLDNTIFSGVPAAASIHYGGFTVRHPTNGTVWHYVVGLDTTVKLTVLDELGVEVLVYDYGITVPPAAVTHALVEDEVVIACAGLPTLWGVVGSGVILAAKQASVNPGLTALDIPKGICIAWAGRCVISTGDAIYFSDALYPRTYVSENALNPPGGTVYGLHVNKGGALIIVTSEGVYALPEDAAASGQVVIGIWSKLTDYNCAGFQQSCVSGGRVFGLTDGGYRLIDDAGSDTIPLDESVVSRSNRQRISFSDYRQGKIFGGQNGVYVSIGEFIHYSDLSSGVMSWWTTTFTTGLELSAILIEDDGGELFLMNIGTAGTNRFLVRNGNNRAIGGYDNDRAFIAGRIKVNPGDSPVVRRVSFTSNGWKTSTVMIRDTIKTITPIVHAPVIGTDSWGAGTFEENRVRSLKAPFAVRGDDLGFEVSVLYYPTFIPDQLDVEFKGPGKRRV